MQREPAAAPEPHPASSAEQVGVCVRTAVQRRLRFVPAPGHAGSLPPCSPRTEVHLSLKDCRALRSRIHIPLTGSQRQTREIFADSCLCLCTLAAPGLSVVVGGVIRNYSECYNFLKVHYSKRHIAFHSPPNTPLTLNTLVPSLLPLPEAVPQVLSRERLSNGKRFRRPS